MHKLKTRKVISFFSSFKAAIRFLKKLSEIEEKKLLAMRLRMMRIVSEYRRFYWTKPQPNKATTVMGLLHY